MAFPPAELVICTLDAVSLPPELAKPSPEMEAVVVPYLPVTSAETVVLAKVTVVVRHPIDTNPSLCNDTYMVNPGFIEPS